MSRPIRPKSARCSKRERSCRWCSAATIRGNGKRPITSCSDAIDSERTNALKETFMKLCRYDDDRMGVVRGDLVHDVTEAQTEIRKSMPYAMKGDQVIAALPQWRERIERMADKATGKPIASLRLLPPVARPTKLTCAPTNYQAHIEEMAKASQQPGSQIVRAQSAKILEAGMFLKANSALIGPSEYVPVRFPERRTDHEVELVIVIGKAGSDIPQSRALEHV